MNVCANFALYQPQNRGKRGLKRGKRGLKRGTRGLKLLDSH